MKFKNLAVLFSDLESTSKRLEMIDFLSKFFEEVKSSNEFQDLDKIIYLLQGELVSNIKQFPKIGIAEKMIIEALSLHSGIDKKKIKEILIKKGDIGATAELILAKKKKQKSLFDFEEKPEESLPSLEISELYSALQKIALSEGVGSQDIKLGILRGLMRKCSPLENKYLLRIITSTLRVGVSTLTIIDGLAIGFTGVKENRNFIEMAYNLHPDLGDITKILAKKGIGEVQKIGITYGIPIRMMLASRVPYGEIIEKLGSPFIAEYKLDGERLQIHKQGQDIKLFSRRLLEISEQYPDVCQTINENIQVDNVIIEGEVVAMDSVYEKMLPFQVLSKRRRKYDVEGVMKEVPVCLFLFDLLKYKDESFIDKPFLVRRKKLEEIVLERDELRIVKSVLINNTDELLEFFNIARNEGNEGVMAKSIKDNSVYQAGNRGFLWIKLKGLEGGKLKDTVDVVLIGAFYGKGRRTGVYGTYIGAVYDPINGIFIAFTRFFSGLTDELSESLTKQMETYKTEKKPKNVICEDIPDVWLEPEIVVEIFGDEITVSEKFPALGYSMRFPVFQRVRPEKGPVDITTVDEIKSLYESQ
ncbi:MAG: ATP-dependent DNA ligase [Candidatus Lokiarchaeota archaeon]|nr:ATP-dependent DNA ligase [Candidatus Lokiarchaeota archaeon]